MGEAKRLRRLKSALGRLNGAVPAGGGLAPSVASRLNTVDELAALADEWLADTSVVEQKRNRRAQSVITALCDYLRSPANDCDTAPADAAHLSAAGRIRTHILDTIRQHVRWRENPHPAEPMHAELSTEKGSLPLAAELNQPPKPGAVLPGPWSHLAFNFSNAVFYDVVDLGEAYWAGPVTFDGAVFTHDAYFCNSLYGEDAVFSRCEYRDMSCSQTLPTAVRRLLQNRPTTILYIFPIPCMRGAQFLPAPITVQQPTTGAAPTTRGQTSAAAHTTARSPTI